MGELWDVYTIDRRLTGKTCFRGDTSLTAALREVYEEVGWNLKLD